MTEHESIVSDAPGPGSAGHEPTGHLAVLASEAYVVGFPLVFGLEQVDRSVREGLGALPAAPFNTFCHARALAGPGERFVSINNDTVYSVAQIDLGIGPVLLSVPDAGERYHVLQFVDAWTNNFAYIGTRATGAGAREYLLLPPDGTGSGMGAGAAADHERPDVTAVRFPTRIATIVGRWAVDGPEDLPAVHALQDALTLTPVLRSLVPPAGVPEVPAQGTEAMTFFERLRVWSQAFPPAERDREALASYTELGLTGEVPVADLPSETIAALETGYAVGREALETSVRSGSPLVDHWQSTLHAFDYNLDFFEVGALDEPAWKLDDPRTRYAVRAGAALGGLWGNHGYEAAYSATYEDADGALLSGEHVYRLRLAPTPPVGAFWSLTMYDLPGFFLVANAAERYSIGDRTRGIVYDDDGGLTITMSATRPTDPTAAANWLPTPAGEFRPMMRMYAPGAAVLSGDYRLPAIERIG
ncbi:hypothetical protein LLS1_25800 [Leifsonia sp. LS1]|uniref:DUF1254 domain-containing protein n=1 Tax=Leifsonia sp. LS1 TaxID=2828483 RepID=UPI001CFCFA48|nr:DUF1254 domain-containing protein [Leifsonia sp. LS1]GIT80911.1 hypothetical protein LLS1_25800 [Leifsonia sp. LS1]